jgi:hypothetical protein
MKKIEQQRLNDFAEWIANARPGSQCIYWRGHLAEARIAVLRLVTDGKVTLREVRREFPDAMGNMAYEAHERGLVCLTQRRVPGTDQHDYIATRTTKGYSNAKRNWATDYGQDGRAADTGQFYEGRAKAA